MAFIIFWSVAPEALAQPANDNCASATVISGTGPFPVTITQDTATATTESSDPILTCGSTVNPKQSHSVWFRFTPSSNGTVSVDTIGSSYDTVLTIFTGVCGSLTAVACNDDSSGLQSSLSNVAVTAGVPILIEVTSFSLSAGGTLVLNFFFTVPTLFQGPAQGTSSAGAAQSTDSFPSAPEYGLEEGVMTEVPIGRIDLVQDPVDLLPPLAPPGSNEVDDASKEEKGGPLNGEGPQPSAPLLLSGFQGITQTTSIPPDPIMAAGPNHLMGLVNSNFAIFTKSGTKLKEISATTWFQNVLSEIGSLSGAFDPKVVYDHHSGRWIMVWLATDTTTQSWILISTSDDADPNGTWCNFAIRGDRNGPNPSGNWSDYEDIGVDNQAIYLTANQFTFGGGFAYVKIRILNKTQLYNPACPALTFTDFWDLRDPGNPDVTVFTTRPAVTFGTPGVEYLINDSPYFTGTFMTLWSLTNPLSATPTLMAVNVPVTASTSPPDADQLGGSSTLIDVGGGRVRNAVYRNGSIWTAHSVAGGTGNAFARARYVRIAVSGPTVLEDVSFGLDNCWLYYPAVTVDVNTNLVMVYNQSCTTTFAGIRYTGRTPADTGLQASAELKAGEANYVKIGVASNRNRWGDYSGIAVDPADPTKVWMFAEYAASPANTWGTFFGQVSFGSGTAKLGVFRNGDWFLDLNGNGLWDGCGIDRCIFGWGAPTDMPVVGDWTGTGTAKLGVFRNGDWFQDLNGNGLWDGCGIDRCIFGWGIAGDLPVVGDWTGSGTAKLGVFRNGDWFQDLNGNGLWDGCGIDRCIFGWGLPTDMPVVGDWTSSGTAKLGVFRNGDWFLDLNGNGVLDGCGIDRCIFGWGVPTDVPVVGDWTGTGTAKLGVFRNGDWFQDLNGNGVWDGCGVDGCIFGWGLAGDRPVAGGF